MNELLLTERTYVADLKCIVQVRNYFLHYLRLGVIFHRMKKWPLEEILDMQVLKTLLHQNIHLQNFHFFTCKSSPPFNLPFATLQIIHCNFVTGI